MSDDAMEKKMTTKCDIHFKETGPIDVIENVEFDLVPRIQDYIVVPRHGVDAAWKVEEVIITAKSSPSYGKASPVKLIVTPHKV